MFDDDGRVCLQREAGLRVLARRHAGLTDEPLRPPDARHEAQIARAVVADQHLAQRDLQRRGDGLGGEVQGLLHGRAGEPAPPQLRDGGLLPQALRQLGFEREVARPLARPPFHQPQARLHVLGRRRHRQEVVYLGLDGPHQRNLVSGLGHGEHQRGLAALGLPDAAAQRQSLVAERFEHHQPVSTLREGGGGGVGVLEDLDGIPLPAQQRRAAHLPTARRLKDQRL